MDLGPWTLAHSHLKMNLLRALSIRLRLALFFLVATSIGALSLLPIVASERRLEAYGSLAGLIVLALLIAWVVGRSITEPLAGLREKLDRLAEGQWNQVLKDRSGDEVSALYDAVNRYVLTRDNEKLTGTGTGAAPPTTAEGTAVGASEAAGLRLLLSEARAMQTAYDFPDGAGRLLAAANAHLKLEWSSICLLDSSRQTLRLIASAGLSDALSHELALAGPKPVSFAARDGVCGEVIDTSAPVVVNKGERDPRFKPTPAAQSMSRKIRSLACLPLKTGGELAGVGNFCNVANPAGFGESEMAFLQEAMELLAQLHLKVRGPQEAFREAVSGLHEYEYWKGLLAQECQRFRRRPSRIALVKLKCAFPRTGLPPADQNNALAGVGSVLRETMRGQDGATRRRDSFYVFLPDTDTLGALFFAGRVKDRVDAIGARADDPDLRFVAAMGVASCPEHVTEPEALQEATDQAVRESLRVGDCRLVCYQREMGDAAFVPPPAPAPEAN
ncbi:MAG: GAF domain-containing protein [Candidatus Wallbacteria bacterium]|nr:GAF domain-containing protein [Candidatus Wallbacteria bacterium]